MEYRTGYNIQRSGTPNIIQRPSTPAGITRSTTPSILGVGFAPPGRGSLVRIVAATEHRSCSACGRTDVPGALFVCVGPSAPEEPQCGMQYVLCTDCHIGNRDAHKCYEASHRSGKPGSVSSMSTSSAYSGSPSPSPSASPVFPHRGPVISSPLFSSSSLEADPGQPVRYAYHRAMDGRSFSCPVSGCDHVAACPENLSRHIPSHKDNDVDSCMYASSPDGRGLMCPYERCRWMGKSMSSVSNHVRWHRPNFGLWCARCHITTQVGKMHSCAEIAGTLKN